MDEEVEQQEADARAKKCKSSSASSSVEVRVISGNVEMKRREKMNSNGLAQTIGNVHILLSSLKVILT